MNLYIADMHFGHKNVINFDKRPFDNVEQMNETLLKLWNNKVSENDHVWILGDFCYRSNKNPLNFLKRMKGHKHLITGNHDWQLLDDERAVSQFESIDDLKCINDKGQSVVLCHYPLAEWDGSRHGTLHVYGHIHSSTDKVYQYMAERYPEQAFNAGCMINGYSPVSLDDLIKNNKDYNKKHLKGLHNEQKDY